MTLETWLKSLTNLCKGLCNNYQEGGGGAEKVELSSKNLDNTPIQNKKTSSNLPSVMLKITSHPLPPPPPPTSHHTGKLKTGLSCHHSFNNDKGYYVTSSIEKDVDRLIEDLDKAFAKYQGAYHIRSKSKTSEARKREERKKIKEQEIERFK